MNPEFLNGVAGRLFAPGTLLGRKLIKLIEVVCQKVSRMFGIRNRNPAHSLVKRFLPCGSMLIFPVLAQVCLWYLIVFLPQPVQASALVLGQEMRKLVDFQSDGRLRSDVKLSDFHLRQDGSLSADENSKPILLSQHPAFAAVINQEPATHESGDNGQIWD